MSPVGNESECKSQALIYLIVLAVATAHTKDSFLGISIGDSTSHTMQDSIKRDYSPTLFLQGQSALPLCLCQAYMHHANLSTRHKQ